MLVAVALKLRKKKKRIFSGVRRRRKNVLNYHCRFKMTKIKRKKERKEERQWQKEW